MSEPAPDLQRIDDDERRRAMPIRVPHPEYARPACEPRRGPCSCCPQTLARADRPRLRGRGRGRGRHRSHPPARGRAARRAHHRQRPRARRGRPAGPQRPDRDLAGQRRRPLPPQVDQHPAPLDPNFTGAGRCMTDDDGRYRFITIKPGAYPWRNHANAWRPAHIHLSLFGRAFTERLVTQMYFPGDPLFAYDPIFQSVRDPAARERMISRVRPGHDSRSGRSPIPSTSCSAARRDPAGERVSRPRRRRRRSGRSSSSACAPRPRPTSSSRTRPAPIRIEGRVLDSAGAPVPDALVEIWQADAEGRYDGGWAGDAAAPTPTAASPSRPSSRAPCASRTAASRRPT